MQQKNEKNRWQEKKRDNKRERAREHGSIREHILHFLPFHKGRIRPVKEPNLALLQLSLCVRKQEHLTTTPECINPSC